MGNGAVSTWSDAEKIGEAMRLSLPRLAPEAREEIQKLLTPAALAIVAGVLVAWIISHFFGIGEIVDIILLGVGIFAIGLAVFEGVDELYQFGDKALNARTQADLNKASEHFAEAVAILGVQALLAFLFRGAPRTYRGRPLNIGPRPPRGPGLFARPPLTSTRTMQPGFGVTGWWGEVRISRLGSGADRRLAALHENVHRLLTPKFEILRTFRVRNNAHSYDRSALRTYMEEAIAETVAQVGVNGFRSVFRGISFPVREGYVTIMRTSGDAMPFLPEIGGLVSGGLLVAGMRFELWITAKRPEMEADPDADVP